MIGSVEEAKKIFDDIDKKGKGKLDKKSFKEFLKKETGKGDYAELLLVLCDTDHNEKVKWEEFLAFYQLGTATDPMVYYNHLFRVLDKDNSGELSNSEIKKFYEVLDIKIKDDEIKRMVAQYDKDKNGKLNFNESMPLLDQLGRQVGQALG